MKRFVEKATFTCAGGLLTTSLLMLIAASSFAETIPFDSPRWDVQANESRVENYLGRQSLLLKGGVALLEDSRFTDGIVEFDIAFTGERGFMGGIWRVQDTMNYEEFYIRPHETGQPDACQYTPVINGVSGWQIYHGAGYGVSIDYDNDTWLHVKIVVSGGQAEVFVGDVDTPALFMPELKRAVVEGKVGVSAGNFAPAHFSNFSYQSAPSPTLAGSAGASRIAESGTVMSWAVSNAFGEKSLADIVRLPDDASIRWKQIECEGWGLANLARVNEIGEGANCVYARVMVQSGEDQIKPFRFGYSDRARVFLNGTLVYAGDNTYRSRDFRYLGTIGFFDEVYLSLKKGPNEIRVAVSESFGGWGLIAQFPDTNGISVDAALK